MIFSDQSSTSTDLDTAKHYWEETASSLHYRTGMTTTDGSQQLKEAVILRQKNHHISSQQVYFILFFFPLLPPNVLSPHLVDSQCAYFLGYSSVYRHFSRQD